MWILICDQQKLKKGDVEMILRIENLWGNANKDLYRPFKGLARKLDCCYKRDFYGENDLNIPVIFVDVKSKKAGEKIVEEIVGFLDKNCKDYGFDHKIYK